MGRGRGEYGMLFVLAVLVVCFSVLTLTDSHNVGADAGREVAATTADIDGPRRICVITPNTVTGTQLSDAFVAALRESGRESELAGAPLSGGPPQVRSALERWREEEKRVNVIVCPGSVARWGFIADINARFPRLAGECRVVTPANYRWPAFLGRNNLLNIAQQISIIAIIAIGMTLVIITAGIDLSVGSLIGLAAVTTTVLIRDAAGAREASAAAMAGCAALGIAACAFTGFVSGFLIAGFRLPPFIVTLGMMLMARGLALTITDSQSVNEVPESFGWLGSERSVGVPHSVLLMFALYGGAHFVMTRTRFGRHVYAIGGNVEAARLAGVPVQRVQLIVYTCCGLLAGLGGVIMASKHRGVEPNFGFMDELTVIAAVVVGGTSLMGGQGRVLGTLIGAFIIAVIRNGMNQVGVPPNPQMIVMGGVILLAVLIDQIRKGTVSWRDLRNWS